MFRGLVERYLPYKFNTESHVSYTPDGYILKIFRVLPESADPQDFSRPVAFIQHGLLNTAENWVGSKEYSLASKMIEEGYDVWLGNSRGNLYSRGHLVMDPERDSKYSQFSFYEMGIYDIPSMIDYVRNYTG